MDKLLQRGSEKRFDAGADTDAEIGREKALNTGDENPDTSVTGSYKRASEGPSAMEPMGFEPTTSCMPCKRSPI